MTEGKISKEPEGRSDLELANSWLDRENKQASKRLGEVKSSQKFYTTYKPKPVSRPRGIEPGSLDATDWDIAEAEDRQWPEEQEEMLEDLKREEEVLIEKLDDLGQYRKRMGTHDPQVIAELAGRERARLAAIEEVDRKKKEEKEQRESSQREAEEKADKEANPEKVRAVIDWLESRGSWGSGKKLIEYTDGAPSDVTKGDLKAAFLKIKPLGIPDEDHDTRGYYLTALAHKVLQESDNPNGEIELQRPITDKYGEFREIGNSWEKGTLILIGDFYRDEGIGSWMRGGKVEVKGDVGPRAGSLMSGGKLEITGDSGYGAGFGMTGGEIHIHGNAGANVGQRMHNGLITVDKEVGPNWAEYGKTEGPNIGLGKEGGKVVVNGKEY